LVKALHLDDIPPLFGKVLTYDEGSEICKDYLSFLRSGLVLEDV